MSPKLREAVTRLVKWKFRTPWTYLHLKIRACLVLCMFLQLQYLEATQLPVKRRFFYKIHYTLILTTYLDNWEICEWCTSNTSDLWLLYLKQNVYQLWHSWLIWYASTWVIWCKVHGWCLQQKCLCLVSVGFDKNSHSTIYYLMEVLRGPLCLGKISAVFVQLFIDAQQQSYYLLPPIWLHVTVTSHGYSTWLLGMVTLHGYSTRLLYTVTSHGYSTVTLHGCSTRIFHTVTSHGYSTQLLHMITLLISTISHITI